MKQVLGLLSALSVALGSALGWAQNDTVRVVAASDLQFALTEVADTFRAAHPEVTLELSFGSSGTLYTQLTQGRPADLFFSADASYPRLLEEAGLAAPNTRRQYAVGRLVVWVSDALVEDGLDPGRLGLEVLRDPRVTQLAIANPVHAPYGRGAVTLLTGAGLLSPTRAAPWEEMSAGLEAFYDLAALAAGKPSFTFVYGENVSQAAQLALSSTGVGVIALSLALSDELAQGGAYWLAPLEAHGRLDQHYLILRGRERPAVVQFYDFFSTPEARNILRRYGFALPGGRP